MLPPDRVIAGLEYRKPGRAPVGEIGVDCVTLVAGTPESVAREVRHAIQRAGLDTGLVLVSSSTLMVGVQCEDYLAMLSAR